MRRLLPALFSLAFIALLAAPADAVTGELIKSWGEPGVSKGKLGFIYGLALDRNGNVWVADSTNNRIQRFSGGGHFQRKIDGHLGHPEGVDVGPDNKIYVTDSLHGKIKVFNQAGDLKLKWGSNGSNDGQFGFPTSVAVAPNGDVYVADRDNDRVQKFTSTGAHVASFESLNLDGPNGVYVDPSDSNVYIADANDDQVVKIGPNGNLLDQWDTGNRPSMLAVHNGYVYVTNGEGGQVEKFETDGDFVTAWSGPDGMDFPCGVAVTEGGKVYVAEFSGRRVQKFEG